MHFTALQLEKYRVTLAKQHLPKVLTIMTKHGWWKPQEIKVICQWLSAHPEELNKSWVVAAIHSSDSTAEQQMLREFAEATPLELRVPEGHEFSLRYNKGEEEVAPGIQVLHEDHNPFNKHNAHPDVEFVAYDLGGQSYEAWHRQFSEAFALVEQVTPELYTLMLPFLDSLVPMGYTPGKQLSSSYKETPGILYLSYTETVRKQAEALVHEIHHTIFNAIDAVTPLLRNGLEERYVSGYRPDPRHIRGCFLGFHAFAAVQAFYWAYYAQAGPAEHTDMQGMLAEIWNMNLQTLETLQAHGDFTPHGKALLEDCITLFEQGREFYQSLPEEVRRKAEEQQEAHGRKVRGDLVDKFKINC